MVLQGPNVHQHPSLTQHLEPHPVQSWGEKLNDLFQTYRSSTPLLQQIHGVLKKEKTHGKISNNIDMSKYFSCVRE